MASRRETAGTQSQEVKAPQAPCPSGHRRFVQLILQGERMMKRSTKFLAILLSLVMVLALLPMSTLAIGPVPDQTTNSILQDGNKVIDESGSTAYTLPSGNNSVNVTLSVPGKEAQRQYDIVLCIDKSSSSKQVTDLNNQIKQLVSDLKAKENVGIKLGVIVFSRYPDTI
jgi:hypothetical protein